ncbi:MAG: HDOD domain-containing protein [Phycisphaeraceae bacterium]
MTQTKSNPQATLSPPAVDSAQDAMVLATIQEISHIATLPEITLRIIRIVEDPDSSAQDLNKIITNDPALGARILKVVNSAFYGLPGQIGSINRAIVLLGLNAVKNIAIAASLAKLFRGGQVCPQFNAKDIWQHSIAVATGTQLLAKEVGLGLPDEAFLAGLIHDIGIMVEMQARRAKLVEAMDRLEKEPNLTFRGVESLVVGATHEQFGAALCKFWKFPASFGYVTGFHHRPLELASQNRTLTALVHVADVLSKQLNLGYSGDVEHEQPEPRILDEMKLTPERLAIVIQALPKATEEAAALIQGPA